jgi:hypothetical protein
MNLTNNNPVGCRQVAMCGGLDAIAALLVAHFPSPSSEAHVFLLGKENEKNHPAPEPTTSERLKGKGCEADEDLEMVVVALGVLCNLVEKDERNRYVAGTSVACSLHLSCGVVTLLDSRNFKLCSICALTPFL